MAQLRIVDLDKLLPDQSRISAQDGLTVNICLCGIYI